MKEALPPAHCLLPGKRDPSLGRTRPRAADEGAQPSDSPCAFLCLRVARTLDFALLRRGPRGIFDVLSPPPDPAPGALGVRFG